MLYSIQVERHALAGILQNPEVLADVDSFLSEKDFFIEPHNVIYSCLRQIILAHEKPDKVLLAQKIKNLGISFKEGINIFDYIEAITFAPITKKATIQAAQELVKLRALREIESSTSEIKSHVSKSVNQPLETTIAEVDAIYAKTIKSFSSNQNIAIDLFEDMYESIEETGNNPKEEIGISTPYSEFNRLYGGLRDGNVYIFVSRPKQGKTTFLDDLIHKISKHHKIPCLIIDTEMSSKEIKFRTAAAISKVPLWYLETGRWRTNEEYVKKIRETDFKNVKQQYKVFHIGVGNMPVDLVSSLIRRWHMLHVGRGKQCVIAYDYLKLTNEKLSNNWAEHQALGEKVDKFKRLSEELQFPFISAAQANRSGENKGKLSSDISDDGAIVAISDRLNWFSTYVGHLRRKAEDEIVLDTPVMGTHKLIELFARYQGKDAMGHRDRFLRVFPDGKRAYVSNYINFTIDNFEVIENGSLRDSIAAQNAQFLLQDPERNREDTL